VVSREIKGDVDFAKRRQVFNEEEQNGRNGQQRYQECASDGGVSSLPGHCCDFCYSVDAFIEQQSFKRYVLRASVAL
jgi:hypothetical protein